MLFIDLKLAEHDFAKDLGELLSPSFAQSTVVSTEEIDVVTTGHDWDIIAYIENKSDDDIIIDFYDIEESIKIAPHEHHLLLANDEGRFMLLQLLHDNFIINYND